MIVLDANVLMYAHLETSPMHKRAARWLQSTVASGERIGIPLQSAAAFIRITTHRKFLMGPLPIEDALATVESWFEVPQISLLYPGEAHWRIFRGLLIDGDAIGPLASDAQMAATAIEYGATLCTTDKDFARFPGLRWMNPLLS